MMARLLDHNKQISINTTTTTSTMAQNGSSLQAQQPVEPRQPIFNSLQIQKSRQTAQQQLRCYLCETPKAEYSLVRSFGEVVCRSCVNFEGPDRVLRFISSARRFKSIPEATSYPNNTQQQALTKPTTPPNELDVGNYAELQAAAISAGSEGFGAEAKTLPPRPRPNPSASPHKMLANPESLNLQEVLTSAPLVQRTESPVFIKAAEFPTAQQLQPVHTDKPPRAPATPKSTANNRGVRQGLNLTPISPPTSSIRFLTGSPLRTATSGGENGPSQSPAGSDASSSDGQNMPANPVQGQIQRQQQAAPAMYPPIAPYQPAQFVPQYSMMMGHNLNGCYTTMGGAPHNDEFSNARLPSGAMHPIGAEHQQPQYYPISVGPAPAPGSGERLNEIGPHGDRYPIARATRGKHPGGPPSGYATVPIDPFAMAGHHNPHAAAAAAAAAAYCINHFGANPFHREPGGALPYAHTSNGDNTGDNTGDQTGNEQRHSQVRSRVKVSSSTGNEYVSLIPRPDVCYPPYPPHNMQRISTSSGPQQPGGEGTCPQLMQNGANYKQMYYAAASYDYLAAAAAVVNSLHGPKTEMGQNAPAEDSFCPSPVVIAEKPVTNRGSLSSEQDVTEPPNSGIKRLLTSDPNDQQNTRTCEPNCSPAKRVPYRMTPISPTPIETHTRRMIYSGYMPMVDGAGGEPMVVATVPVGGQRCMPAQRKDRILKSLVTGGKQSRCDHKDNADYPTENQAHLPQNHLMNSADPKQGAGGKNSSVPRSQQPVKTHKASLSSNQAPPPAEAQQTETLPDHRIENAAKHPNLGQQQQQLQQQPQPQRQSMQSKCMCCGVRLDDQHFVQCPTVRVHKFCFACSKASIENQRYESKRSKQDYDKVFCPSGNKCLLPNESSPWMFMNNEIETIFRESNRQSSGGSNSNRFNNAPAQPNQAQQETNATACSNGTLKSTKRTIGFEKDGKGSTASSSMGSDRSSGKRFAFDSNANGADKRDFAPNSAAPVVSGGDDKSQSPSSNSSSAAAARERSQGGKSLNESKGSSNSAANSTASLPSSLSRHLQQAILPAQTKSETNGAGMNSTSGAASNLSRDPNAHSRPEHATSGGGGGGAK